jgi:hypothetical protein
VAKKHHARVISCAAVMAKIQSDASQEQKGAALKRQKKAPPVEINL